MGSVNFEKELKISVGEGLVDVHMWMSTKPSPTLIFEFAFLNLSTSCADLKHDRNFLCDVFFYIPI